MSSDATQSDVSAASDNTTLAMVVYVLYLVGLFTGISALVGLVLAYVQRGQAPAWMQTHYTFQIRTFWIGLGMLLLGAVLSLVIVGYLLLLFWLVWTIVRCVKGISLLNARQPISQPQSWMFG